MEVNTNPLVILMLFYDSYCKNLYADELKKLNVFLVLCCKWMVKGLIVSVIKNKEIIKLKSIIAKSIFEPL